jgi:glycosyltransferase involved in cell wall biosynthesis
MMVDPAALAGRSVIYCPHGWAFSRRTSLASRWASQAVEWALQGRVDAIHCISQHEYECGARAGISVERMFCLPNRIPDAPVQALRIAPPMFSPASALRVAFVGRLDRQKGFDVLLQAARLAESGIEFVVAGAAAVDRADRLDALPANMRLLGWLAPGETQALLQESDVVVVPSRWEGFGLTALEAMRAGKALVASNVDALPELVDHQITGLLTPPCDGRALAGALASLSRERAQEMGRAARLKFELFFSFEAYADALRWRYAALRRARAAKRA